MGENASSTQKLSQWLSIIIESLDQRHAAASVNFKSLMINIKVMTNFGMEFLMAMFKQRQNFCKNQSTQALKTHDPEKKSCLYESKGHNVSLNMKSSFSQSHGTWEFWVLWFDKSVPSKLLLGYKEIGIGSRITA